MDKRTLLTTKDIQFIESYIDKHFQRGYGDSLKYMMFLSEYKKVNRRKR